MFAESRRLRTSQSSEAKKASTVSTVRVQEMRRGIGFVVEWSWRFYAGMALQPGPYPRTQCTDKADQLGQQVLSQGRRDRRPFAGRLR